MALRVCTKSLRQLKNAFGSSLAGKKAPVPLNWVNPVMARGFSASVCQLQQSKAYKGLVQKLDREIKEERQHLAKKEELPKITGFDVKTEGPNVTMTKNHGDEKIVVKFTVNNSLTSSEHLDGDEFEGEKSDKQQPAEPQSPDFRSRPPFTITITRGSKNLSFNCSFMEGNSEDAEHDAEDDFEIDEFAIHEKEMNENVYSADCGFIDGDLYDNLLDILDERGIGQEFGKELVAFSSSYELRQYVDLLEKLKSFAK